MTEKASQPLRKLVEFSKKFHSKKCDFRPKYEKYLKSKNDFKRPLWPFNKKLWPKFFCWLHTWQHSRFAPADLSFPSGSSESPTPASAEGASCPDGWVGGDQNGPLILLIFKYVNKQNVLIPNMVSKLVYVFFIKSNDHFSSFFWGGEKYSVSFIFPVYLNRKRKLTLMSKKTTASRSSKNLLMGSNMSLF